jgi:hypothetical protein
LLLDKKNQPIDAKKVGANEPAELPSAAVDALKRADFLYTPPDDE